jgi:hypothetical protein
VVGEGLVYKKVVVLMARDVLALGTGSAGTVEWNRFSAPSLPGVSGGLVLGMLPLWRMDLGSNPGHPSFERAVAGQHSAHLDCLFSCVPKRSMNSWEWMPTAASDRQTVCSKATTVAYAIC